MNQNSALPKVIFFDAVGTLFGIKGSVGHIYSQIADRHGVEVAAEPLNKAFGQNFAESVPLAFDKQDIISLPQKEYQWWYKVVRSTFEQLNALKSFKDFEKCFAKIGTKSQLKKFY